MATSAGSFNLTGCNVELQYDIVSQSIQSNSTTIRLYLFLNVTNNYISWGSGSGFVHTYSQEIGTYYARGSHRLLYSDFTFTHNNDGNLTINVGYGINTTFVSGFSTASITMPKINRYPILNSGTNFTDEENPVYNITAYNTYPLRVKIEAGGNTQLIKRDLDTQGSTIYTLELTNEERDILRTLATSNTLIVRETICAMNGNTELSANFKDYKMTIVNGNPVFSDFDFEDVNATTVALTGSTKNNVININGYSNIKATITTSNKAEAIKSATMVKYRFSIGDNSTDISYSNEEDVNGVLNSASNGTYNLYAIDSRNNSTLVTKQATNVINYEKLYLDKQNCSITRDDGGVGENAILTLNGTFWNNNFGVVNNSIKSVSYRLKKSDSSTWITGTSTITPTTSNNSFSFTGYIASDNQDTTWDLDDSYNIEVTVSDELSSMSVELILASAVPTLSLDKNGVGVLCAYDNYVGGGLQVKGNPVAFKNMFKLKKYSQSVTVGANDFVDVTIGNLVSIDGYYMLGVIGRENGYGDQWLISYSLYGTSLVAMIHSKYNVSLTATISCYVVYVKTDYYNEILVN